MAKSTQDKKKRTSAALAGTLNAFTEAEAQETETEVQESETETEAEPTSSSKTDPAVSKPKPKVKPKRTTKTTASSEAQPEQPAPIATELASTEKSRLEAVKASLNRLTRRTQRTGANMSAETLASLIENWLANVTAQGLNRPEWASLISSFVVDLKTWPEPTQRAFYQQWQQYCTSLNFELNWLVEDQLKNSPFKPTLQALALAYLADHQRAQAIQADTHLFKRYSAWRQALAQPKYRSLNQTLFVRLSYHKLIPPPPPEIYLAAEETRAAYIRRMLLRAAEQDLATFLTVLAETET